MTKKRSGKTEITFRVPFPCPIDEAVYQWYRGINMSRFKSAAIWFSIGVVIAWSNWAVPQAIFALFQS